ncbi:hypothetical protein N8T08_008312 [Aspergillus melleus]|uniref:Uncharacterized protein n=1 Tax=Aspergillus melleus TaxID=138277 RepID=A0ACC3AWD2_9EURO|nr:hypothetical protein N8T08_008312 [Aspergillus melleus]
MGLLTRSLHVLLLFVAATATLVASTLTVTIPPSTLLPNPNALPAGTHATLTSLPSSEHTKNDAESVAHPLSTSLTRSGTFVFRSLHSSKPQSYLLDIRSAEYVFAPYRVDVSADGVVLGIWETFRGNPWDNRGAEKFVVDAAAAAAASGDVTVEAKLLTRRAFYEQRSTLDPEMRAEFEKQSRSSPISGANAMASGGGAPGNFDLAGWMAGAAPRAAAGAETAASPGASTGRDGGDSTRRRK